MYRSARISPGYSRTERRHSIGRRKAPSQASCKFSRRCRLRLRHAAASIAGQSPALRGRSIEFCVERIHNGYLRPASGHSAPIRMQRIQFFSLPRPVQERFIESTRGYGAPVPLLYRALAMDRRIIALTAMAGLFFAGCITLAKVGFGDLQHRWALNPPLILCAYCALLSLACTTLVASVRSWKRSGNVPFRRGLYLFPVGVIHALGATLEIHPFQDLVELTTQANRLRMRFSSGASFDLGRVESQVADKLRATLFEVQKQQNAPSSERSKRDQALLDPLLDTGFKNPFSPHESMRPVAVARVIHWFFIAAIMGAAAGLGLGLGRNWLSARRLYNRAMAFDTPAAYRAYLARGGTRPEVRELLLPKAELREVRSAGSVDALERYLDEHAQSKIRGEMEAALREALLRELREASRASTLTRVRGFRKNDPHLPLIQAELQAAQKEFYHAALTQFQSLSKNSPDLNAFFEKLLGYAEQHGPKVEIRFRRRVPPSVERADVQVRKSPYCDSPAVPPAQYFNDAQFTKREATVAAAISKRFEEAFSKDVLSFELAAPLPDDGPAVPSVASPTLLITHRTELSAPFTSRKPKGVFVGVGMIFKAQLLIPGEPSKRTFEFSTWAPPDLKRLEAENWGPAELYGFTAQDAFDQFLKRFFGSLFHAAK